MQVLNRSLLEITVSEVAEIFKEIQERPSRLFEMIRMDIREVVGKYLTELMNVELTHFLGRALRSDRRDSGQPS